MTQYTNGRLKPWAAIIIIALSVTSLIFADALLRWLHDTGRLSASLVSALLLAYTLLLFILLLRGFSLRCVYELDGVKLRFSRVYVKKPRLEETVYLREVVFFGAAKDAGANYAPKRTRRFVSKKEGFETLALVYRRDKKEMRVLFSPNPEFRAALEAALGGMKKKK